MKDKRLNSARWLLCLIGLCCFGQVPAINPGGIVNAASLAAPSHSGPGLAPGILATIFGQNLAPSSAQATTYPLPRVLNGTSVLVNGEAAPLLYVSPGQINFQVPKGDPHYLAPVLAVQVSTVEGMSAPSTAEFTYALGVFTAPGTGCGQAAATNVHADGSVSVNDANHAAEPGDYLEIYSTGYGEVLGTADGVPQPPPPVSRFPAGVWLGDMLSNATFSGLSTEFVGITQTNLQIPSGVTEGCSVPLQLVSTGYVLPSQIVTVSIHSGRGTCAEPPIAAEGNITMKRTIDTSTGQVSEAMIAAFPSSYGRRIHTQPLDTLSQGPWNNAQGPRCPLPGFSKLNAGTLDVGSLRSDPSADPDGVSYNATLPSGTLVPGNSVKVSAEGGPDVGAFRTNVDLPPDLTITPAFSPARRYREFIVALRRSFFIGPGASRDKLSRSPSLVISHNSISSTQYRRLPNRALLAWRARSSADQLASAIGSGNSPAGPQSSLSL